jgi:hypothetical protein
MPNPYFIILVTGKESLFDPMASRRARELLRILNKDRKLKTPAVPIPARPALLTFIWFRCGGTTPGALLSQQFTVDNSTLADSFTDPSFSEWTPVASTGTPVQHSTDPNQFVWTDLVSVGGVSMVSITSVYKTVRWAPANSVLALEFLSHGFVDGPVLNDTTAQVNAADPTLRDPNDTDGRGALDFQSSGTMGIADSVDPSDTGRLAAFINGFVSGGALRVYGCNIQDKVTSTDSSGNTTTGYYKSIAREVMDYAFYRLLATMNSANGDWQSLRKKMKPTQNFQIDMNAEYVSEQKDEQEAEAQEGQGPYTPQATLDAWQRIRYPEDTIFFPAVAATDPVGSIPSMLTRSYSQIIGLVARRAMLSYTYLAANALASSAQAINVFGPPPGCSGEVDGSEKRFGLMRCSPLWVIHWFNFFFGATFTDPMAGNPARDYALFNASVVAAISAAQNQ